MEMSGAMLGYGKRRRPLSNVGNAEDYAVKRARITPQYEVDEEQGLTPLGVPSNETFRTSPYFRASFTAMLVGPTKAGKTFWTRRFLDHSAQIMDPPPQRIYYCYRVWQPKHFTRIKVPVTFCKEIPDETELKSDPDVHKLLILDDQMVALSKSPKLLNLFTVDAHHHNISVLFIVQNMFYSREVRTVRLNSHYIILMNNPSDISSIASLAQHMFHKNWRFMMDAYEDAVIKRRFGYLVVDNHPQADRDMRLYTSIFPGEIMEVYLPADI